MAQSLESEIRVALNRACAENGCDTPDFILAEYLLGCLSARELLSSTYRGAGWDMVEIRER